MKYLIARLLTAFLFFLFSFSVFSQPYVVMLSLDGFRWDYPDKVSTPNFDYIAARGVKAHSMIPSFPTKTFPNHYTMATGLYPDHHGIVQNTFYDPETGRVYRVSDRSAVEDPSFYGGEPLWVTAEKQGTRSASLFWVGSEAAIEGIQPSIWKKYDMTLPFEDRIDTIIKWLQLPEPVRPHLVMWYMREPDETGHDYPPGSPEVNAEVAYLDSLMGVFLDKLSRLGNADSINIIITSDHGMCPISQDRVVYLDQWIKDDWFSEIMSNDPCYNFLAKPGYYDSCWTYLEKIPHVSVWKHGQLPERLHYGNNPRTLDFIMVADSSWQISYNKKKVYSGGNHGYDNANSDMHAIFYAMGPAFVHNPDYPTFYNIDLYDLVTGILQLKPSPNDGSYDRVKGMLKHP